MSHSVCPCCGDRMTPGDRGHNPMTICYRCPDCGAYWLDEWCSAVDGTCPHCKTQNIPAAGWDVWEEESA